MEPVTAILMAAAAAGAILGGLGKSKTIDPEWLKAHFGPNVVNQETIDALNHYMNGPEGQKVIASASQQAQQFQTDLNKQAAAAGFGPSGGADSGASIFSTAAAGGAKNAFIRDARATTYGQLLPMVAGNVQDRMSAYLNDRQRALAGPNTWERIGEAAGTVGALSSPSTDTKKTQAPKTSLVQNTPLVTPQAAGTGPQGIPLRSAVNPVAASRQSLWSRFGRRMGRWSRGVGNYVTPGSPFGGQ